MCETGDQKAAMNTDAGTGAMLQASYGKDFGETQLLYNNLNTNLSNIVQAGPEQFGFEGPEYAMLNSQSINNAAAANKQVQQSIGEKATSAVPGVQTGVTQALEAEAATKVENNLSNQEAQTTEAGFEQGNKNYEEAVKQQEALPQATLGVANDAAAPLNAANKTSTDEANSLEAEQNWWVAPAEGAVGGALKGLSAGLAG